MGATLPADKQKEFSELSKQLSALTLQFQQNVLRSTNEYKLKVADVAQLSGLPQAILDAAKEEAKKDTFEGYVFTLKAPSYVPFMKYADNRELRKTIYLAYNSRSTSGESNNIEVLRKIAETRLKIANLLGYKCHADKILRHRMAENKASFKIYQKPN